MYHSVMSNYRNVLLFKVPWMSGTIFYNIKWCNSRKKKKMKKERRKREKDKKISKHYIERGRFNFSSHISLPLFLYILGSPSRNLNEVDIMPLCVSTDRLAPFIFIRGQTPRVPGVRFWLRYIFLHYVYFINQGSSHFPLE